MITVELHSHTEASGDCLMRPADIVRTCGRKGIDRLAVTDHNTIAGALAVRALAPELVIVGEEVMTNQGELLAYFLTETVPAGLSPVETIERLRAQGAAISVSHPFDRLRHGAWQEADLAAIMPLVDAIEVFNARCVYPEDNQRALAFAAEHGMLGTVGSDAHSHRELGRAVLQMELAGTPAELRAGFAAGRRVTRLSSPLIHLTSRAAVIWKRLARGGPYPRPGERMNILVGIVLSVLFGIMPMALLAVLLTLFDRYEKEPPLLLVGVFLWGAIVAAGAAFILNTIFGVSLFLVLGSEDLANVGAAVISAPFVEETVKGLAVLVVFLYFRGEFDSVLDGVIYGGLVGFGFAAAENINYIFNGFLENGSQGLFTLVFVRVLLIPFLHATLTGFTGIGLAVGRLNRGTLRYAAPVLGWVTAIGLHTFHNLLASVPDPLVCLLGKVIDWTGFIGMFIFVLWLVWREGKVMREQLREEVALGNLTEQQYQTAVSIGGQMAARWGALTAGHWRAAAGFTTCWASWPLRNIELARLGPDNEPDTQARIERLRQQIATASRSV